MIEISEFDNDTILNLSAFNSKNEFFSISGVKTHFKVSEFQSKDGNDTIKINVGLLYILEGMRVRLNIPIFINSGYRSPTHNIKIGGAKNSQHVLGRAADITISNITTCQALQIAQLAEKMGAKGIGVYNNFVHVDNRQTIPAIWDNTGERIIHGNNLWY